MESRLFYFSDYGSPYNTWTLPAFQINTIFCIGRNYVEHIQELNNEQPDEPIIFIKPITSIIGNGENIQLPRQSSEIHHEVELVVAIGQKEKTYRGSRPLIMWQVLALALM
ncbi:MAG: fumarylacetoacetate hydrolase family protein [Balneolaceae bacterium]|nr:fumarylacetoacetate hydrolase family protein [Balneolaceae bacterium]